MDTEEIVGAAEVVVPEKHERRKPRGYLTVQKRLQRALKQGASISGLLAKGHTDVGYRVRDGRGVLRSNLKVLDAALERWEKSEPIRRRAVRRTMRKPLKKAARSIASVPVVPITDEMRSLMIIEAFSMLSSDMQRRTFTILHGFVIVE